MGISKKFIEIQELYVGVDQVEGKGNSFEINRTKGLFWYEDVKDLYLDQISLIIKKPFIDMNSTFPQPNE